MKKFDIEQLTQGDGKEGNPVLVSYQSKVYDLSESKLWKGGVHMNRHKSGSDLTSDIKAAPHGEEMLERYQQVGELEAAGGEDAVPEPSLPKPLAALLDHVPMLRRHPHPMVVHFPIVFSFSTVVFILLYLVSGVASFETTAVHCLAGAVLFTPIAMVTGWFTWWLNYQSRTMKPVTIKIWCSLLLWFMQLLLFAWYLLNPTILTAWSGASTIYLVFTLTFVPIVSAVGWFGAALTFPE